LNDTKEKLSLLTKLVQPMMQASNPESTLAVTNEIFRTAFSTLAFPCSEMDESIKRAKFDAYRLCNDGYEFTGALKRTMSTIALAQTKNMLACTCGAKYLQALNQKKSDFLLRDITGTCDESRLAALGFPYLDILDRFDVQDASISLDGRLSCWAINFMCSRVPHGCILRSLECDAEN
jgi:hypothetical protein